MVSLVDSLRQAGHLSSAQISHATRVQAKLVTPRTLLEVLQQLGTIETATIAAVVRANPDAVELAPLLVELGYVHESQLQTLAAVLCIQRDQYQSRDALVTGYMQRLWRHALATALGAKWLAQRQGWRAVAARRSWPASSTTSAPCSS